MAIRTRGQYSPASAHGRLKRDTWLPLSLLAALLLIVFLVWSGDDTVTTDFIAKTNADRGTFRVGSGYANIDPAWFDPFLPGRLTALTVLLTVMVLASTTALGTPVIRAVRRDQHWPPAVTVLAGFAPGYLMTLGPLQLIFAALPLHTAAWVSLCALPVAALLTNQRALRRARAPKAARAIRARPLVTTIVVACGLVVLAGVHRLQAGRFYLLEDSLRWFLGAHNDQLAGLRGDHLAQWNQQADEWIFSAPAMFHSLSAEDYELPMYATQALGLASFICLAYALASNLARRRRALAGVVAVAAMLAATTSIVPTEYVVLPGGDNPMLAMGIPARQIGVLLPWLIALLFGRPLDRSAKVALALVLVGFGFTSIHVFGLIALSLGACTAWHIALRRPAPRETTVRLAANIARIAPLLALGLTVFAFHRLHRIEDQTQAVWWLIGAIAAALAGAASLLLITRHQDAPRPRLGRTLIVALALPAAGLVLANNFTGDLLNGRVRETLGIVLPGYKTPLASRPDLPRDMLAQLHFPRFSPKACDVFPVECYTFGGFLTAFGVLFALAIVTWFALGPLTADARVNARRYAWLLLVALLAVGLVVVLFTGVQDGLVANILGRVAETSIYSLLALAAITFAESPSRVTAYGGLGFMAAWIAIPAIATGWPAQMADNMEWIVRHVS